MLAKSALAAAVAAIAAAAGAERPKFACKRAERRRAHLHRRRLQRHVSQTALAFASASRAAARGECRSSSSLVCRLSADLRVSFRLLACTPTRARVFSCLSKAAIMQAFETFRVAALLVFLVGGV